MRKTRTVVCGQKMRLEHGTYYIEIFVPAWKNETVFVPITAIPSDVLQAARRFPDNKLRFYAKVNLDAPTARELLIGDFENFDLRKVFREPAIV